MTRRSISLALAATAAGALAGPPVMATAKDLVQQVVVTNTAENPVITEAKGTTAVKGTVGLAEGTSVKLADGSQPFSLFRGVDIRDEATKRGTSYTVPAGKRLVVTQATGVADEHVIQVAILRENCSSAGNGSVHHAVITGSLGEVGRTWYLPGEMAAPAGCELVPFAMHRSDAGLEFVSFQLYGYLIDE